MPGRLLAAAFIGGLPWLGFPVVWSGPWLPSREGGPSWAEVPGQQAERTPPQGSALRGAAGEAWPGPSALQPPKKARASPPFAGDYYIHPAAGRFAQLESPEVDPAGAEVCVRFLYYLYSLSLEGQLSVEIRDASGTVAPLWNRTGMQSASWLSGAVTVPAQPKRPFKASGGDEGGTRSPHLLSFTGHVSRWS